MECEIIDSRFRRGDLVTIIQEDGTTHEKVVFEEVNCNTGETYFSSKWMGIINSEARIGADSIKLIYKTQKK